MSAVTCRVGEYVKEKGINLSKLSRDTEIPYQNLYDSLANNKRDRDLRDWELLLVCDFLGIDPREFNKPTDLKEE